jgi:hypothetical protein
MAGAAVGRTGLSENVILRLNEDPAKGGRATAAAASGFLNKCLFTGKLHSFATIDCKKVGYVSPM